MYFYELKDFSKLDSLIDRGKKNYYKTDYFIVENFNDNAISDSIVDSFALKNKPNNMDGFTEYKMIFFKKSDLVSIENLKINPKDFDNSKFHNNQIFSIYGITAYFFQGLKLIMANLLKQISQISKANSIKKNVLQS